MTFFFKIRVVFVKNAEGQGKLRIEGGYFRNLPPPTPGSCLGDRIFIWGQQGVLSRALPKLPPPLNPPLKVKIERKRERCRCESRRKREEKEKEGKRREGGGMSQGKEEINGKG